MLFRVLHLHAWKTYRRVTFFIYYGGSSLHFIFKANIYWRIGHTEEHEALYETSTDMKLTWWHFKCIWRKHQLPWMVPNLQQFGLYSLVYHWSLYSDEGGNGTSPVDLLLLPCGEQSFHLSLSWRGLLHISVIAGPQEGDHSMLLGVELCCLHVSEHCIQLQHSKENYTQANGHFGSNSAVLCSQSDQSG